LTRALIAGANGLVARAMAARFPGHVAFSHAELDITNRDAVFAAVRDAEVVINGAVLGVDECEEHPDRAQAINVDGPTNLAEAAAAIGAGFVHFSSNYVLDPVNVYGRTKLEGERAVAAAHPRALIVRTSWVFGRGNKQSFIINVHEKLIRRERVQTIGDSFANTTSVNDLADAVEQLIARGKSGTFNVINAGIVSYDEIARYAAQLVGAPEDLIDVVRGSDVQRAPRPRYTPMEPSLPMRHWREAYAEFVRG
jgi:dTDP-4-dehydrorhamnose reductase